MCLEFIPETLYNGRKIVLLNYSHLQVLWIEHYIWLTVVLQFLVWLPKIFFIDKIIDLQHTFVLYVKIIENPRRTKFSLCKYRLFGNVIPKIWSVTKWPWVTLLNCFEEVLLQQQHNFRQLVISKIAFNSGPTSSTKVWTESCRSTQRIRQILLSFSLVLLFFCVFQFL